MISANALWYVDDPQQEVNLEKYNTPALNVLKAGSKAQEILNKMGDDLRIDWGYFYLAAEKKGSQAFIADKNKMIAAFANGSSVEEARHLSSIEAGKAPEMAIVQNLGMVRKNVSAKILVAYNDLYSAEFFGNKLLPWWNRTGNINFDDILFKSAHEFASIQEQCNKFDQQIRADALKSGGQEYAELCELAFRQAVTAHKLVASPQGKPYFFSKENFSNGCIGKVDVTYPSIPLFLVYSNQLAKALCDFIFYYSESGKWTKNFPAHDVGSYPMANGQIYKEDMPVEEAGNMLILAAAVCKTEQNPSYAKEHWNVLKIWAEYLKEKGFDPENQLCTDDFAGHLTHNTNLSVKAIMGIASFGYMAGLTGDKATENEYIGLARKLAIEWENKARDNNHYSLTFDKKGTWSQKYNLVWDKILNLNIFPAEVTTHEIEWYKTVQNRYGLPLDSRDTYTKSDWILWTATLTNNNNDFRFFVKPVYDFVNETPHRIPLTDWHWTLDGSYRGFRARSLVGGYFMKVLNDKINNNQK